MAGTDEPQPEAAPQTMTKRRGLMPPAIVGLVTPSLQVGAGAAVAGTLFGVGIAIYRDFNPYVLGIAQGASFFMAGSSLWLARSAMMRSLGNPEDIKPFQKVLVSAGAGSTGGAMMGLMRGPSNIIPSIFVWGVAGAGVQYVANRVAARPPRVHVDKDENWKQSRWSPLKRLTDDEYIDLMMEKKLKVSVEIALIDDRIAELRAADNSIKADGKDNESK